MELADLTTLGVGGPVADIVVADTEAEAVAAVRESDRVRQPVLFLGAGSNVVAGDRGFDGRVVRLASRGVSLLAEGDSVELTAQAGESWARLVEMSLDESLAGIECLAAIPGTVGAVPVQNVGAYGQEVSGTISRVRAWDRLYGRVVHMDGPACGFGYRTSRFKEEERFLILSVSFRLHRSVVSSEIRCPQLAGVLGVPISRRVPLGEVHAAVVGLRRSKGMVLDPTDPDTRSAGSFFTNPVVDEGCLADLQARTTERFGAAVQLPVFPAGIARFKLPAGWLVERAGFRPGYRYGDAAISAKHALALTVRRGRSADPLLTLARTIRSAVHETFDLSLEPEPTLVGASL